MTRPRIALATALAVLVLAGGSSALAAPTASTDPLFWKRSVANHARSMSRGRDQLTNPEFLRRYATRLRACAEEMRDICMWTDPYRVGWEGTRGRSLAVRYPNRYGARISGHLWLPRLPFTDPLTGSVDNGPFPAIVIVPGLGGAEQPYWSAAQGLAERGYVVLTIDPQGQGASDVDPAAAHCEPNGAWRSPQEMGVREYGDCAGHAPPDPLAETPGFIAKCLVRTCEGPELDATYERQQSRFVFGALDAVTWLVSGANPRRALVDASRIGVAGHSLGARGAEMAGNGDPLGRFDAAVSWDSGSQMPSHVPPRVPTMFQVSDSEEAGGPYRKPPDPDARGGSAAAKRFAAAGVDTAVIGLRASTHQEWLFTPPYGVAAAGQFVASSLGERVALYYTAAWFDRYLKGASSVRPVRHPWRSRFASRAHRDDARRRLFARAFDGSIDASSIGQGRWDPLTNANVPYRIAGLGVPQYVSIYHRSWMSVDGVTCQDLRRRCPAS